MSLPLADILREHWASYTRAHPSRLTGVHYRAVRRVLACRTPELGGRLYQCANATCRQKHYAYHSCNHRNCTQCGARDQQQWAAKQEAKLLGVPYFMVTFTIPSELRSLCLHQPKILYHLLLKCSATALHDVTRTKLKNDQLQLHLTSVLHTWGRQAQHHPHIHITVPAVALDPKNQTLHRPKKRSRVGQSPLREPNDFLVHYQPLAARFRSLIQSTLKADHPDLHQKLTPAQHRALGPKTQWNVQLQPVGSGKTALRYLARYVQRSAFSAKRILGYDAQGRILLKWTDSTTKKTAVLKLHVFEFIRRWCLHILPKGFMRVRHYGLAAGAAKKNRQLLRFLLGQAPEAPPDLPPPEPFPCPHCQGKLTFLREIPRPRGPPR